MKRRVETWQFVDSQTSVLWIGAARLTITAAGVSPEEWWAELRRRDELEVAESRAATRLARMSDEERNGFARRVLDDGSSGGGWRLAKFVRTCQRSDPAQWPDEIRLTVLKALGRTAEPPSVHRAMGFD